MLYVFFFFFQAEDGIRDLYVTGVQTCALPIWSGSPGSGSPGAESPGPGKNGPPAEQGGPVTAERDRGRQDQDQAEDAAAQGAGHPQRADQGSVLAGQGGQLALARVRHLQVHVGYHQLAPAARAAELGQDPLLDVDDDAGPRIDPEG